MKILIKPSEIIERCVWDRYYKYCLNRKSEGKKHDIKKIIEEDIEFEISEEDALLSHILKCVETDDLIHRCNQYIKESIQLKSVEREKKTNTIDIEDNADSEDGSTSTKKKYFYMIKKKNYIDLINTFKDKFPIEWQPKPQYKNALHDVLEYIEYLLEETEKLEIYQDTDKYGTHDMLYINHITKTLKIYNNK